MKINYSVLGLLLALGLGATAPLQGQTVAGAPTTIDYQGKALDATGSPLANTTPTNYEMRFRIYDAQEGGNVIWSEKQIVTVSKGLFSVRLGEGTSLSPAEGTVAQTNLSDAFTAKERFLGVTIVITGQTPVEILPRLAFLATPFSYVANRSLTAERLILTPSTSAPSSALNLSQLAFVTTEINANNTTLTDQYRTVLVNAAAGSLQVNLPGAITTRREYLIMKKDTATTVVSITPPSGGTINGDSARVIRLKIRGESVTLQNTGGNDWWITGDTIDKTPVGTIISHAGSTNPPAGYCPCVGGVASRTDPIFVDLFNAIGTAWGAPDATRFNLPDLRGMFLRGVDQGRGVDDDRNSRYALYSGGSAGDAVGSYEKDAVGTHGHAFSASATTGASGNHNHSVNADVNGNDTTRLGLVYISNDSEQTPSSGDAPGRRWEMAIFNKPAAMPWSGDHSHSVSVSGTTNNTGAAETRPENMSVVYFIKY
jgi:microcystin-dependent protein